VVGVTENPFFTIDSTGRFSFTTASFLGAFEGLTRVPSFNAPLFQVFTALF
jgi:hypothetical protein